VRSLVGTLSIVCLLLGAVNAQSNSLTQQHSNSGSYGITATTQAQDQQHHVDLARELFISIPPLNAAEALNRFAKQTGIQMLYSYEQVFTRKARPVVGQYAVMDALTLLLEGSGLEVSLSSKGAITISDSEKVAQHNQRERINMNSKMNTKKTLLASMVGLFAAAGGASSAMAQGDEAATAQGRIDEIIVTANKREQSLQDTAMSITAIGSQEIERKNLVSYTDYLASVPGVSLMDQGVGRNEIKMRGIGANLFEQATVSTYFGDVPLTNPVGTHSSELKLIDINRVEVLRGPQGTLYGSGALGGTIRSIPNSPDLTNFEGSIKIGFGDTKGSSDSNSKVVGVFNFPIIDDQLALRVATYRIGTAGYTDYISTPGIESVAANTGTTVSSALDNGGHTYKGIRASLLWQASDKLSASLILATQDLEEDGFSDTLYASEFSGRRVNNTIAEGNLFKRDEFEVANLVIEYDMDWGSLTSSSSYIDGSEIFGTNFADLYIFGLNFAADSDQKNSKEGVIQEFRLTSQNEGALQYIVGAYYENFKSDIVATRDWVGSQQSFVNFSFTPGASLTSNLNAYNIETIEDNVQQLAFFGELTYAFNDVWGATLGARRFDYEREFINTNTILGVETFRSPFLTGDEQGSTVKFNISYTPNDDAHLYAQWSEGFRLGTGFARSFDTTLNPNCDIDNDGNLDFTNVPLNPGPVKSDTTENIEIGGKFSFLDNSLKFNIALYHIDWQDFPIQVPNTSAACFVGVEINGGEAQSKGVEIETRYAVTPSLQVFLLGSYNESEFSDDTTPGASKGDRLPTSPRFNGSVGLEYEFLLAGNSTYFRSDYSYVGGFFAELGQSAFPEQESGDYGKLNARFGMAVKQFTIEVSGSNLTDEDAFSATRACCGAGWRVAPRTVSLELGYQF